MLMGDVRAEVLMRTIDPAIRDTLTAEQEVAIRAAAQQNSWGRHPVDIRLSLPLLVDRLYLALVAGRERRHPARLDIDRIEHPLGGPANAVALACLAGMVGLAAFGLLCFLGAI